MQDEQGEREIKRKARKYQALVMRREERINIMEGEERWKVLISL